MFFFMTLLGVSSAQLLLTPMLDAGRHAEARAAAKVKVGEQDYGYSGFMTVPSQKATANNNIFFWYQPCLHGCNASEAPFLVWLQGGPGGPGTFGAMTEVGNWFVAATGEDPTERCNSWCLTRSCLFVDQPVEAGFSYQTDSAGQPVVAMGQLDLTDTSPAAMAQVHGVVSQVLELFPELKPAPLVITGESYGGLYTANLGVALTAGRPGRQICTLTLCADTGPTHTRRSCWPPTRPSTL